jgi:hypothetical protein
LFDQSFKHLLSFGILYVKRYSPFIRVECLPIEALLRIPGIPQEWRNVARRVAPGLLNLYNIDAKCGKDFSTGETLLICKVKRAKTFQKSISLRV